MFYIVEVDNDGFKIYDSSGNLINPAKEETLSSVKTALENIRDTDGIKKIVDPLPAGTNNIGDVDVLSSALPDGAATETTLASADATLTTIDSVLDAIKDTDGIKKITDPLPAGTNNIGDVDVVSSVLPTGAATEATLSAADTKLGTIDAVLDSIKDTDGIKKITDQLPTGTNEIGKVAQGTKAAGSGAWPTVIYNSSGNAVGVYLDGSTYRFQTEAKVAKGASTLVHLDAIDTVADQGRLKATIYTQDGNPVAFGSAPSTPSSIKNSFCLNGTADSLLVNGSVTPVVFTYLADSTYDVSIQEVQFVLSSNSITFGTSYFGAVSGPLTNGLLVEITSDGNTGTVFNLRVNEDFKHFASPGGFDWVVSSKDSITSNFVIGGGLKLHGGTSDKISVTVRDNISSAGLYFKCFVKGFLLGA